MVSHGVIVLVHWPSVRTPRTLVEQKRFVVSKLGFRHFIFYLPFSVIISDITLLVLGYTSCPLSLFLKDSLLVADLTCAGNLLHHATKR